MKRALDIVVSATGLIVLAPVLAVVAAAVKIKLGSPVLFLQMRPGRGGRPFTLVKFRTMSQSRPGEGSSHEDDEARLSTFGNWLRRTSLDELPELWNVLKGEMSLVGPRPLLLEYCERYSPEQARRHEVRPGITGWAQIHGRNDTTWEERLARDVWYVDHRNLLLDLRILIRTVRMVIRGEGVSASGHSTMPRFRGTGHKEIGG
jgi:lipopolysaccharide/colanic/teichoic acid biosynthesis glycosyltransferase